MQLRFLYFGSSISNYSFSFYIYPFSDWCAFNYLRFCSAIALVFTVSSLKLPFILLIVVTWFPCQKSLRLEFQLFGFVVPLSFLSSFPSPALDLILIFHQESGSDLLLASNHQHQNNTILKCTFCVIPQSDLRQRSDSGSDHLLMSKAY